MDEQGVISVFEHRLDLHTVSVFEHRLDLHTVKETEAWMNKGLFRYLNIGWISIQYSRQKQERTMGYFGS